MAKINDPHQTLLEHCRSLRLQIEALRREQQLTLDEIAGAETEIAKINQTLTEWKAAARSARTLLEAFRDEDRRHNHQPLAKPCQV